ncbi:MAG: MBL fold metallo-hydrolase [Gammaproteobacteria bacterium]|nr:MBL fold metallo-hydrolase [Gammaproteobacteria bacterium]
MRNRCKSFPTLALCAAAAAVVMNDALAQRQPPTPQIAPITEHLYRASNGFWHGIFLVTNAGIVLVDPLNPRFATWLKGELAQRFPGIAVRYVIYSHSHWDHVEGGSVFADTATFIAHQNMRRNMDGRYPHMPGDMIDRNGNGQFEPEEFTAPGDAAPGVCGGRFPTHHDADHNGHLTPAEYFTDIVPPDIVYSDRLELVLGGQTVELRFLGRNHADDTTAVVFPGERVVFSADFPADALVTDSLQSLPSACGPFDGHPIDEWIASYRLLESFDFDTFAGGHGRLFAKNEIAAPRQFFEDLKAAVSAAIAHGQTLAQMKQSIRLEQYRDWAQYERLREMNIEAAYRNLTAAHPTP